MGTTNTSVNLDAKFALFTDQWSPKIVGQVNDFHIKIVKVEGEFVWHTHDDTDEFFLVHSGTLTIQLDGGRDVTLEAGEFFVVPKGTEHRPLAAEECQIVLLEPAGVVNTGDANTTEGLTSSDEWI